MAKTIRIPKTAHPEIVPPRAGPRTPSIRYTVAMPEPWTHNLEVTVELSNLQQPVAEVRLPAWTPGSYKIREFARNVSRMEARTHEGEPLAFRQIDKDTWQVETGAARAAVLSFRLYGFEFSVRTAHVDDGHAFFQPTNALPYLVGHLDAPATLEVRPWGHWRVACPLPRVKGRTNTFYAQNYDWLADSPVQCSDHQSRTFEVDGVHHEIVVYGWGHPSIDQMARDFPRIVRAAKDIFGGTLPYENYTFIIQALPNQRGGLEHLNAQVSQFPSWEGGEREGYDEFLSLVSHEHFHAWNVKRLRPLALGPFDYNSENYTQSLWVSEGLTTYYEWIVLARAGLVTPERVFKAWARDFNKWAFRPGNDVMPVTLSSFLAWTKLYMADENAINTMVSYYLKGMLVGLLLDMEIRRRTKNKKSLDDAMRIAFERYGLPKPGFPEGGFEDIVAEIAPGSWKSWFAYHLDGTGPLDLDGALRHSGHMLERPPVELVSLDGARSKVTAKAWLGVETDDLNGKNVLSLVRDGSPASRAGLSAKDEFIALDGFRLKKRDDLAKLLRNYKPGDRVTLSVFREERLRTFSVELGEHPASDMRVAPAKKQTAAQKALFKSWLGVRG